VSGGESGGASFLFRAVTGYLIHGALVLCAVALAVFLGGLAVSVRVQLPIAVMIAVAAFTAGMAGVYWVKGLYIQHFLPELMDEVTRKILGD
jgi:hypothetical protein